MGKGDTRRPEAVKGAWDRNWDRIFGGETNATAREAEMNAFEAKLKRAVELSRQPDPAAKL